MPLLRWSGPDVSNYYLCTNLGCLTDAFVIKNSLKILHTSPDGEVICDVWFFE